MQQTSAFIDNYFYPTSCDSAFPIFFTAIHFFEKYFQLKFQLGNLLCSWHLI